MTLEELKNKIEEKTLTNELIILVNADSSFLSNQYINAISNIKNKKIQYLDDLSSVESSRVDIFGGGVEVEDNTLRVYKCDTFLTTSSTLDKEVDLIIVCNKIDDKCTAQYSDYIIRLPVLEEWMIKDYVYSLAEGVKDKDLDWLMRICNNNIDRLDNEISKLTLFDSRQRQELFQDFVDEQMFDDLSEFNIFNISNALQSRDRSKLKQILPEIKNIDVEAVGLVKILWQNFRKMITVWMNSNPTPENTGLKSNQIWAIKNLPKVFNKEQLINIFEIVSEVDYKLKSGMLDANLIVDYLTIKTLSV